MAKLGLQDRLLHPVGQLVTYQALAGSNEQAPTGHHATCSQLLMSLTACEEYRTPGVSLNFSM